MQSTFKIKKYLLFYVGFYLMGGGFFFAFIPEFTQKIMLSNVLYDEPMVRMMGIFMAMLGSLVAYLLYDEYYKPFYFSIVIRSVLVSFVIGLWFQNSNPLFLVIAAIALSGLLPSYGVLIWEKMKKH